MEPIRILKPGDEPLVEAFCSRHPDTTIFFANNAALAGLEDQGERFQGTYAAAFTDGEITALAGHFWNGNLILEAPERLPDLCRAALDASGRALRSLMGTHSQTRAARAVLGLDDAPLTLDSREVLFALDLESLRVPEDYASGRYGLRLAALSDFETLLPWRIAYRIEALGETETPAMRAEVEEGLQTGIASGRLWVLELDGALVAVTGFTAMTATLAQIGGVWTPPELRSRGYARAAVAGSLLAAKEGGVTRSILFTAEDNHAAQRCYRGLGYEEIGDFGLLIFTEPHHP